MKICIPLSEENLITITSKARYLAIYEDLNSKPSLIFENPALYARVRRPEFIKSCIENGANTIIAAHGSFCSPSYKIIKQNNIKAYVVDNFSEIPPKFVRELTRGEVFYSNALAMYERIFEKH